MLSKEILADLVQRAPDAVIVVDEAGTILFANTQVEVIFGYTPKEIKNKKIEDLIPERFRDVHIKHRMEYAKCPKTRPMGNNLELVGLRKSGEEFPAEISISPLQVENGLLVTAIVRDISKKTKQEKRLSTLNVDLERFVYIASHDLQEPLRSMQQILGFLEERLQGRLDREESQLISGVVNASVRMSTLIQDLLSLSRLSRPKELEMVDCNLILKEVQINLKKLIDSTGTQIIIKNPLPVLRVFTTEFRLLFQNLIDNAIKFHKKKEAPVITIDVRNKEKEWLFSVADNGIGIEEKFLDRLFVVFQRFHNRDEYPGNGIGLAHCKKIVELHQGDIWAVSEYGEGTVIYFTLPHDIREAF